MSNSKRRIHVVATAALCVLVVALAIGVIAQQLAASRLSGDIAEQRELLAKSRGELKDRARWRNDYGDLSLKLGGRMSVCSWSDQMPFMMAQVSGLVEANGLRIENLQPEPMTSSGSIQRFPMRVVLQTDLKHLTELLKDIGGSVPLLDIERLEVRNAQGETGKLQINMTVASFVVIDKNSLVARRRAVTSARPAVARPANIQPPRPSPRPSYQPPTPGPAAGPSERPSGSDGRMGPPGKGNGSKPAVDETQARGKTNHVPPGADPSKSASPVPAPEGGAK